MNLILKFYQKKEEIDEEINEIQQSPNILNWYPFAREQNILQIGEIAEELTRLLCNKCNKVTIIEPNLKKAQDIAEKYNELNNLDIVVGDFNNIELTESYDIITLIGISPKQKLEKVITYAQKFLHEDGKFLISIDNKFGIRFFAGDPENILNRKFESLIGYNNEKEKIETFTKKSLQSTLKDLGYNTRFYYPLPDYRIPNVIFSDQQLPEYNSVDKYNPYHTEKSDILINEIDVLREILKTDKEMFTFFANSFLVEATKGGCDERYKYISFNNLRKEEYRLITKISNNYVEKQVVNESANQHYQNIKNNMQILQNSGIDIVDYIEDDKIRSKYIEQKYLLNNVLTEKLEQGKIEEFYDIFERYIKIISIDTYKENEYDKTVFKTYEIEIENKEIIRNLNFMKNGLWDMTLKNCFFVEDKFLFFDQEWNEMNLPVEFILYRSILYTISLRRFINIDNLFEKYDLTPYLEIFRQLDNKLQEKIRDYEMWQFYSKNHKFNIDETKQEVINLNIRSDAQNAANEKLRSENEELRELNRKLQEKINNKQNQIKELEKQLQENIIDKLKRKLKNIDKGNKNN